LSCVKFIGIFIARYRVERPNIAAVKDMVIADKPCRDSSNDRFSTELKFIDAIYFIRLIDLLTNITPEDDL